MRLILDSNIILSCLIKDGITREILTSDNFIFYTLDYVFEEVMKYENIILKKSKMSKNELEVLYELIRENINIIPDEEIKPHFEKAYNIMEHIDLKDSPILACALAISNEGLWTTDKHFDKQNIIKVWKTKDLIKYL
jgi:predicted nucleic acid-binding protein